MFRGAYDVRPRRLSRNHVPTHEYIIKHSAVNDTMIAVPRAVSKGIPG